MKYYVYSGYVGPDSDAEDSIHTLKTFSTEEEVLEYHQEFQQNLNEECGLVCFSVIKGEELSVKPVLVATKYVLQK